MNGNADVAQVAERSPCKRLVGGSIPPVGSRSIEDGLQATHKRLVTNLLDCPRRMTEIDAGSAPTSEPRLSADGRWWWNGRGWIRAESDDGLWRWDGSDWQPTSELPGRTPIELALSLSKLADAAYSQAGAVLATRAFEWRPSGELSEMVRGTREAHRRLVEINEQLGSAEADDLSAVLSHIVLESEQRRLLRDERERLATELRTQTASLGHRAPIPTVKEADDLLKVARHLDDRGQRLRLAAAQLDAAEQARSENVAQAQRELASAEQAREAALAQSAEAVRTAEAEHARAVQEARGRLQRVRMPGPGNLQARFGDVRLHANLIEMPTGRTPAAGARAWADTAAALWRDHRSVISDLSVLGAPGTDEFHAALADRSDALFVLVVGRTAATVAPCPSDQESEARSFVATVVETSQRAASDQEEREVRVGMAEQELETVAADRWRTDAAEEAHAKVERDPALITPIEQARQRLAAAQAETPELVHARQNVEELTRTLAAPPPPLRPTAPTL